MTILAATSRRFASGVQRLCPDQARAFAQAFLLALALVFTLAIGVAAAAASQAAEPASQAPESMSKAARSDAPEVELALFQGRWQRIQSDEDEAARLRSIQSAVDSLSWLMRGMAGGVLRRTTAPPLEVHFVWDGERLQQRVRGGDGLRPVEPGADPIEATDMRGDAFSSSWDWADSGIRVSWRQRQAEGHNVYRIDPTDQTLIVEHTIRITAIDDVPPIVYEARFGRTELPAVAAAPERAASAGSSRP